MFSVEHAKKGKFLESFILYSTVKSSGRIFSELSNEDPIMLTQTQPFRQINQPASMEESRKLERFSLHLPARISVLGPDPDHPAVELITENISAGGAYFPTRKSLREGLKVLVELTLRRESGQGGASRVKVKGTVLRSLPNGMAVRFESRVQMQSC